MPAKRIYVTRPWIGFRAARVVAVGSVRALRFIGRNVLTIRRRGAGGETGMVRLIDLHAASCAGDTLVAIGLAGTIFFQVGAGEARGRVALYLLVTMLPFALLAPVVGPVLDHFRHGRRYALATTMLGRAFLAYMIAEHVGGFTLYPAAFGILVLSRAYGVARSAAVPRVLPAGLGLSEAGARASVFGTLAGAVVAPIGLAALSAGPAWPLRLSMLVFVFGMVTALRLPPRADSDPPEAMPRLLRRPGVNGAKVLSGRLLAVTLVGSAILRGLYGFLALFLAFAIRAEQLPTTMSGNKLGQGAAIGVVAGSLATGSFLASAVGTKLRIRRPALVQAVGVLAAAIVAAGAAIRPSLPGVALLCLVTAFVSGLAKLAVDATIQDRVDEGVRATAFAHSETALMLAWVAGGGLGLVPFPGGAGIWVAAGLTALGALRAVPAAVLLRRERLRGPGDADDDELDDDELDAPPRSRPPSRQAAPERPAQPAAKPAGKPDVKPAGKPGAKPAPASERSVSRRLPSRPSQRRAAQPTDQPRGGTPAARAPVSPAPAPEATINSPGFHLYRPSGDPVGHLADAEDADGDGGAG